MYLIRNKNLNGKTKRIKMIDLLKKIALFVFMVLLCFAFSWMLLYAADEKYQVQEQKEKAYLENIENSRS